MGLFILLCVVLWPPGPVSGPKNFSYKRDVHRSSERSVVSYPIKILEEFTDSKSTFVCFEHLLNYILKLQL